MKINENITAARLKVGAAASVELRISGEMIGKFSHLTGDMNPLHTETQFARRSIYRKEVAHGMIPVGFVSLLDFFNIDGLICAPIELEARFIEPVLSDDRLCVHGEITGIDESAGMVKAAFSIMNLRTKNICSDGSITVNFKDGDITYGQAEEKEFRMPDEPLHPLDIKLEDISKGSADSIGFTIKGSSVPALMGLFSEGIERQVSPLNFDLPSLLSLLMFSTSVGMGIPGKYATFLKFEASFKRAIETGTPCMLKGEVSHMSRSTRIIKKDIQVQRRDESAEALLSGKVSVLVNQPYSVMPSMEFLKDKSFGLGIKGKVAIITGASRGIGETTAKLLALHGAKVIVNYNKGEADGKRISKEIADCGGEAVAIRADVSDSTQVERMVKRAAEMFGAVDILVNNAVRGFRPSNFLNLTWEDVQEDLDVIAKGAFNCCKAAIPFMLRQGGGKIINISTIAAENPPPGQVKYVLSKSALMGLTRALAADFASSNIQVNMVVPNFVETDLVSHIPEAYRKKIALDSPMQRSASPADIAQSIVFLASAYSSFTTGQKVMVTGGAPPYL